MKKWLVIFLLMLLPGLSALAQNEEPTPQEGKIQERMREYIENKLGLSKNESEKFTPIFLRYFREFAQTVRAYKTDKLFLQQKIIELRLRYRTEFRQIMDEPRASRVYKAEDEFRQKARDILLENRQHDRPFRRNRSMIQVN
jgi:hypothetical protein